MADIVPAWMWRDPEEIIEGLLALSSRSSPRLTIGMPAAVPRVDRDRYYTQARRLHVKQLMRGKT